MKTRLVIFAFFVTAFLSALLTTPVSAACQDLNEQIHKHMADLSEMERLKEELHTQHHQTDDPTQRQDIEALIKEIDQERDELRNILGTLERQFAECETEAKTEAGQNRDLNDQPPQNSNGDNGLHPLVIAAIIAAIGAVLAALIGLLRRR